MTETHRFLEAAGLPSRDPGELPASSKRFPDGAQYRIEIPSVEGPGAFEAVLAADLEDVAETLGHEEPCRGTAPGEERVRRDGGAVHDMADCRKVAPGLTQRLDDTLLKSVRGRENLVGHQKAVSPPPDEVSECPANFDAYPFDHWCLLARNLSPRGVPGDNICLRGDRQEPYKT